MQVVVAARMLWQRVWIAPCYPRAYCDVRVRPHASVTPAEPSRLKVIFVDVCFIDGDPAGTGETMRSSGNPFQVTVARQAEIQTGTDFLAFDQHQRQLVLRLASDHGIPQKDLVNRSIVEKLARNRRKTSSHDASRVLAPSLTNRFSNACDVDNRAAFEAIDMWILRKQVFRFLIGGVDIFAGFYGPGNTFDVGIFLARAFVCCSRPSHVAASADVTDKGGIPPLSTHAGCQLIH